MELPNPFTPIFGRIPPFMAGREHLLSDIEHAFDAGSADPNLCSIFVGARGTGKTALLSYLARQASSRGWVVANTSAVPGMLEDIIERARVSSKEFIESPHNPRIKSVSIGQLVGAEWEYRDPSSGNWRTRMTDLIEHLNEQGIGLLITIDEVKGKLDEMIQFASVYQHFVREERNVALLMAGLPKHISTLVSDESVSFLRRARTHRLGRIPNYEISAALEKTIDAFGKQITPQALSRSVEAIDGFPYMMQLVGFRLWAESNPRETIEVEDADKAIPLAMDDLEDSVLEATYRELSDGDLAFLEAMLADESTSSMSDIASRLDKTESYARVYRMRLVEQGIITEKRRGKVEFELPYFKEFLREKLS